MKEKGVGRRQCIPQKESLVAHLCVNFLQENSFKAIKILRKAGFRVQTAPVSGILQPELTLGTESYYGIKAIQKLVKERKHDIKRR